MDGIVPTGFATATVNIKGAVPTVARATIVNEKVDALPVCVEGVAEVADRLLKVSTATTSGSTEHSDASSCTSRASFVYVEGIGAGDTATGVDDARTGVFEDFLHMDSLSIGSMPPGGCCYET